MGVLRVNLNNINLNLNDGNFYEDDPKTIINVRRLPWEDKLNAKLVKKK